MTTQRYNIHNTYTNNLQNVCIKVIEHARDQRRTKALACYYLLKQITPKSILLNYRSRLEAIAASVGICVRTLEKYVGWMIKHDLAYFRGPHLQLTATKRVKRMYWDKTICRITKGTNETIDTVEARLLAKIIEKHAKHIAYYIRIKRFLRTKKRSSLQQRRTTNKMNGSESCKNTVSLSIRSLMALLNLGAIKTTKAVRLLNDLGVIKTTQSMPEMISRAPQQAVKYTDGLPARYFWYKGHVYYQRGNHHEFLEADVKFNPLSYQAFIKIHKSLQCINQHTIEMI
jgi:hypothetical protein